jgi:hypothetical protein
MRNMPQPPYLDLSIAEILRTTMSYLLLRQFVFPVQCFDILAVILLAELVGVLKDVAMVVKKSVL